MSSSSRFLKDWINSYIEYTIETESATIFHKWAARFAISAVLKKKTWLKLGRLKYYPNLYLILVSKPGIAKKSLAIT